MRNGGEERICALLDRAVGLMDAAGFERFDVIGFSIGGWFAQCLAAREPARVGKVVLVNSFTLEGARPWQFGLAAKLWPILPPPLLRAGIMKRAKAALAGLRSKDPVLYEAALRDVAEAVASPLGRSRLAAQQLVTRDSLIRGHGAAAGQPVLIVQSDDDALVGARAREQLRRKYPEAECVVLTGAGHAAALTAPEALAGAIGDFLN